MIKIDTLPLIPYATYPLHVDKDQEITSNKDIV